MREKLASEQPHTAPYLLRALAADMLQTARVNLVGARVELGPFIGV